MSSQSMKLRAGERTKIYSVLSDSMPRTIAFRVRSENALPIEGTVEIESRQMLLQPKHSQHALNDTNSFQKSWTESPYSIYATSSSDAVLEFEKKPASGRWIFYLLAALIVVAAALPMFLR